MTEGDRPGFIGRVRRALFSPSLRWSVAALLGVGLLVGAGTVISTQVALAVTGTDEFCGTTCHSHEMRCSKDVVRDCRSLNSCACGNYHRIGCRYIGRPRDTEAIDESFEDLEVCDHGGNAVFARVEHHFVAEGEVVFRKWAPAAL